MFFVFDRPKLQRMIAIVRDDKTPATQGKDAPFLRLEARDNSVTVAGSQVQATIAATVYEPGVLFIRTTIFRRLLATFTGEKEFTLQVSADGLHAGDTTLPFESADMVLFPIPDQAPEAWPPPLPPSEQIALPKAPELPLFRLEGS